MRKTIIEKLKSSYMAFMIACLFIGSFGCDKEDPIPAGPEVSISVPGLTITDGVVDVAVTEDSIVTISYSVDALGLIEELIQTVDGTSETVSAAEGDDSYTKQVVVNVPYEDTSIEVEVMVTDMHDQSTTESITIQVEAIIPPATPFTEVMEITMGGNSSPSEFSRWDLDIPMGYSGWALRNTDQDKVESVDIFYTNLSFRDNDDNNMFGDDGTGGYFVKTEFTKEDFDAMEDDGMLRDMEIDQTLVQDLEVGDVVAFVTDLDKKGVLYMKEYIEGTDDMVMEIKLQDK